MSAVPVEDYGGDVAVRIYNNIINLVNGTTSISHPAAANRYFGRSRHQECSQTTLKPTGTSVKDCRTCY